jgi:DNA-directed RNA polymerase subunit RPC12/RpoP
MARPPYSYLIDSNKSLYDLIHDEDKNCLLATNSHTKVRFSCGYGHFIMKSVKDARVNGLYCIQCNCIESKRPDIVKFFVDKSLCKIKTPYSNTRAQFYCDDCSHRWQYTIMSISKVSECPRCSARVLTRDNSFGGRYPDLASELLDDDPYAISSSCKIKFKFKCKICKYEYMASPSHRAYLNLGCTQCSGQILTDKTCFAAKYPEVLEMLLNVNDGYELFSTSTKIIDFKCLECNKTYKSSPRRYVTGYKCTYCMPRNFSNYHKAYFYVIKNNIEDYIVYGITNNYKSRLRHYKNHDVLFIYEGSGVDVLKLERFVKNNIDHYVHYDTSRLCRGELTESLNLFSLDKLLIIIRDYNLRKVFWNGAGSSSDPGTWELRKGVLTIPK